MRRAASEAGQTSETGRAGLRPGIVALCIGAALLAGCAARPQDIQSSTMAQRQSVERSVVDMPPGGPAVLGIVERNYSNGFTQELTLENHAHNSGENKLTVTVFGPVRSTTAPDNRLWNHPLATLNVGPELGWFLPGVRMQISNYYAQNRYGPFGYATGRTAAGDACIYAWQRIQAPNVNGNWTSRQGAIIIRLRFCAPRATEATLLQLMTSFNINAYFLTPRWNPYGTVPPPPEGLGRTGVTLLPATASLSTTGSIAPAPARPRVVRRSVAPPPPPPVESLTPDMPIVPPPQASALIPPAGAVTTSSIVSAGGTAPDAEMLLPKEGYPMVPPP